MVVEQGVSKDDIPLIMAIQNHKHWVDELSRAQRRGHQETHRDREHPLPFRALVPRQRINPLVMHARHG
jgi:hypothetical protein